MVLKCLGTGGIDKGLGVSPRAVPTIAYRGQADGTCAHVIEHVAVAFAVGVEDLAGVKTGLDVLTGDVLLRDGSGVLTITAGSATKPGSPQQTA